MRLAGVSVALLLAVSLPSTTYANVGHFSPLSCNANLTVADCDGTLMLSSILQEHISSLSSSNTTNTTIAPSPAIIPCGVCATVDINSATNPILTAPHGIDIQGMLYVPSTTVGTLETAHLIIQGVIKIDPHSEIFTIKLIGDGNNVFVTPHEENLSACESNLDGKCNLGKRPIAVLGGKLDVKGVEDTSDTCPAWVKLRDITQPNVSIVGTRVQAEDVSDTIGNVEVMSTVIAYYDKGESIIYNGVDFGSSSTGIQAKSIKMRYAKGNNVGYINAYSDGVLIKTIYPPSTGDWSVFKEFVFPLDIIQEGNHTLRFDALGDNGLMTLDWFELTTEEPESILHVGSQAASCWDSWGTSQVLLTPSSTRGGPHGAKTLTIKSIDALMGTITVSSLESNLNDPSTWENGLPELSAEVASLNRPVKFDSVEDENGMHGGHLIVFHTPNVAQKLEGIEINHFGQQGILGRYPIHFHFSNNVAGSVVRKNVVRNSNQRCIVIHVTDSVLVEDNVAFDTVGHCFITENGGEIDNTFKNNLGSKTRRQSAGIGASDRDCATFWVTSPRNHFIGNVAAGSEMSGFWFELLRGVTSSYPMSIFTNNTSHNNAREGFRMYPKGYQPTSPTYFDGLIAHSNGDFGMFIKRSRNFRIRNAIFANNRQASISYQNNVLHTEVQDSSFYARLSRHTDKGLCISSAAVRFSLEESWSQIRIKNSNFEGYANVPPSCSAPGQALQLENIQGKASTSNYAMPVLEGNTFTSNDPEWAFQIAPNQFGPSFSIILEDSDGTMNPEGLPGFFVHDKPLNTFFLPPCSVVGGKFAENSELLFCAGACLRSVSFNSHSASADSQMVITSRSNKTYTSQANLDVILPNDEYAVSFKNSTTGEDIYHSTSLAFSAAPACTEYVTKSSFIIAQPPTGYFPLYERFTVTDVAAYVGVVLGTNSIGYIDNTDWWSYNNCYFGEEGDTTRIRLRFSKGNNGGTLQIRLGGKNGDIIATFDPYNTGGWGEYTEAELQIDANVSGLHQVTFVATGISAGLLGLAWWELAPSPPPSSTPTLAPSKTPSKTPSLSPVAYSEIWARKEAGDVSAQRGIVVTDTTNNIGYFDNGDWFTYDNVYFGDSPGQVGRIRLRFSKGNLPGYLQIRLGNENGQVLGIFRPFYTGDWGTYKEATFAIDAESIEGYHQVTFRGWDTSGVLGLDWWELAPPINSSDYTLYEQKEAEAAVSVYRVGVYSNALGNFGRGDFSVHENIWFGEVGDVSKIKVRFAKGNNGGRIEVRRDGRYGPVLGSFYPWNTGGWGNYVEHTFGIDDTVSGLHYLYFVGYDVRGGIWNFDYFELAA